MRSTVLRVLYFALLLLVAVTCVYIYTIWWDEYQLSHPKVTVAEYQTYREDVPFHGILLWKDYAVTSAWEGTVSYPLGDAARVAKGDIVAVIASRAGKKAVRAPEPGYFIAGFDGAEEKWTYTRFWTGDDLLPAAPEFVAIRPGTPIPKGGVIGKMVPQPQELRCIAFVDLPPALQKALDQGVVRIRARETEWPVKAEVRVFQKLHERRGKVYLTLPFFPLDIVKSRIVSYRIVAGGHSGAAVPESCVVTRNGRIGVFVIEGMVSKFVEVKGIPMPEHLFLITEGVTPGKIVILNAEKAREGNVRLW